MGYTIPRCPIKGMLKDKKVRTYLFYYGTTILGKNSIFTGNKMYPIARVCFQRIRFIGYIFSLYRVFLY
jgi:hypothetical protein